MTKILRKERLSRDVYRMALEAPDIARARKAGQFVILMPDDGFSERIPLTIADADALAGTITIIFQAVGATTRELAAMPEGGSIAHLLGPLGRPTDIRAHEAPVACVCGGIGAAPMYPIVQALKAAGNRVAVILGARSAELLILEEELRAIADDLVVVTDDGSRGRKALVTEPLKELCAASPAPAEVFAIGPPAMMKFCAAATLPYGIPTLTSLNTIMVDGTGMCGGCRVTVGGEVKFVCVDGPEFDGHAVDWDSMLRRLGSYKKEEAHQCRLAEAAERLREEER
ncbi:MAG TPA: sulfide/dihydroorotate dehydrogenase-like FAD/NAD-binding protein [Spirochaetales bacterium]|nr:sulfide/dihydroorotate dehydrogenase-like FAD/NAD-binding protein [Spirochaetales bacterium]HRY56340.1 sulfide/dihydroorotate dehydrogenase-like FAD/NAD-binding protein [Spirochaetia bacterium]HRZ64274.1 sulfide/dihydroorotate dehydrogenase-like FAD/NAD-binding protein [Spirochaetia bacterium]